MTKKQKIKNVIKKIAFCSLGLLVAVLGVFGFKSIKTANINTAGAYSTINNNDYLNKNYNKPYIIVNQVSSPFDSGFVTGGLGSFVTVPSSIQWNSSTFTFLNNSDTTAFDKSDELSYISSSVGLTFSNYSELISLKSTYYNSMKYNTYLRIGSLFNANTYSSGVPVVFVYLYYNGSQYTTALTDSSNGLYVYNIGTDMYETFVTIDLNVLLNDFKNTLNNNSLTISDLLTSCSYSIEGIYLQDRGTRMKYICELFNCVDVSNIPNYPNSYYNSNSIDFYNFVTFLNSDSSFSEGQESSRLYWDNYYFNYYKDLQNQNNETSYNNGYNTGYDVGYSEGIKLASDLPGLVSGFASLPFGILSGFLNFDLLGFNIYSLVLSIITLLVIVWLIRRLFS